MLEKEHAKKKGSIKLLLYPCGGSIAANASLNSSHAITFTFGLIL